MKVYAVCYHVFYEDTIVLSIHKSKETANERTLKVYQDDVNISIDSLEDENPLLYTIHKFEEVYDDGMICISSEQEMYYVKELELEE